MAGSDEQQEGIWRWVAGPENGQIINPTFWAAGEPNSYQGYDEDGLCYWYDLKGWNDGGTTSMLSYIVEYECFNAPNLQGPCSGTPMKAFLA